MQYIKQHFEVFIFTAGSRDYGMKIRNKFFSESVEEDHVFSLRDYFGDEVDKLYGREGNMSYSFKNITVKLPLLIILSNCWVSLDL